MRPVALIISFLILAVCGYSQSGPSAAIGAAVAELNKGNVFEGVRQLKEIVRAEPSSPAAYFYLSGIYTGLGRNATAYRYLDAAIKANPAQGIYYHQLGMIRRREGCRPEALAAFQQALQKGVGKEESTVWRRVGDAYADLLSFDKALEAYENALKIEPNDAAAHLALGNFYLDRNKPDRVIVEMSAALKLAPGLEGVRPGLGRAYRAAGDLLSAVKVLQEGIERDPSAQEARYVLAQTLLSLQRDEEGRREMDEYRRVQDRISQTNSLFESAVRRAQAGELERAEDLLRQTLRLAPRYAPALRVLGVVLLNRGSSERAVEMLRNAVDSNPLNAETYFNLATAYLRTGKLAEALDMARRALILDEEDARFYTLLGDIYSRMKRPAEARAAAERSAQLQSLPGSQLSDSYAADMLRRTDSATVKSICGAPQ